jgi:hypothetical protein
LEKIREYASRSVDITLVDRRDYLLFVPNIPTDVMENRDPSQHQRMLLQPALAEDDIRFIEATVKHVEEELPRSVLHDQRKGSGLRPEHRAVSAEKVFRVGRHHPEFLSWTGLSVHFLVFTARREDDADCILPGRST